jgi:hypothetical protein
MDVTPVTLKSEESAACAAVQRGSTSGVKTANQPESQLATRGEFAVAALAIALPLLVLFAPILFSDRMFAMRDAGHYYYPHFKWCADKWGAGELPLWNPHENCGESVHADPTASLWYPGKLVFALPVDFALRFKLYVVGHIVLCAVGAYWLSRRWQASVLGSALAAVSYALGGNVLFQHCNVVYLVGAAWLPFALGFMDGVLRERRLDQVIWLAVVLALMILGGDPQMAYHVLFLGGLYAVLLTCSRQSGGVANTNPTRKRGISFVASLGLVGIAGLSAFLLAAIQILPSAVASRTSERAQFGNPRTMYEAASSVASGASNSEAAVRGLFGHPQRDTHHVTTYDFSVGPWRLAEMIWPNITGQMFPQHRRWLSLWPAEGRVWTPSLYLGLLPLLLGLGMFSLRATDPRIRWLSWTVLLFSLGSFGIYGLGWLLRQFVGSQLAIGDPVGGVYWLFVVFLPKYVLFRYPAKLLVVAACGLSLLAALGWDRFVVGSSRRLIVVLASLGIVSGVAAIGSLVASQFVILGAGVVDPAFGPFVSAGAWSDILLALVHTAAVAVVTATILSQAATSQRPFVWKSLLLSICVIELFVANAWLVPTAPAATWREPLPLAAVLASGDERPRVYRAARWWPTEFSEAASDQRMEQVAAWERATLAGRYALLDDIALVNSQVGIKSADHQRLLAPLRDSKFAADDAAAWQAVDQLGIDYLILPESITPAFAERVAVPDLPDGAALWRVKRPRSEYVVEYSPDYRPLVSGAILSGLAWIALLLIGVVWKRLPKSNNSVPA